MQPHTNPLHTILETEDRVDLQISQFERTSIQLHIGRFVMAWGLVETFLGAVVESRIKPARATDLHHIAAAMRSADKMKLLRALLPSWSDGEALHRLLTQTLGYRNKLAHPVVGMSGFYDGAALGWHLSQDSGRKRPIPLKATEMVRREIDARILGESLLVLMDEPVASAQSSSDLESFYIYDALRARPGTWQSGVEYQSYWSRAKFLFPGQ